VNILSIVMSRDVSASLQVPPWQSHLLAGTLVRVKDEPRLSVDFNLTWRLLIMNVLQPTYTTWHSSDKAHDL